MIILLDKADRVALESKPWGNQQINISQLFIKSQNSKTKDIFEINMKKKFMKNK